MPYRSGKMVHLIIIVLFHNSVEFNIHIVAKFLVVCVEACGPFWRSFCSSIYGFLFCRCHRYCISVFPFSSLDQNLRSLHFVCLFDFWLFVLVSSNVLSLYILSFRCMASVYSLGILKPFVIILPVLSISDFWLFVWYLQTCCHCFVCQSVQCLASK